jgi:hypothetical protein
MKKLYYLYEDTTEIDFYTEDKIIIESKYYSVLTEKQNKLFSEYPAKKRILIDSIDKISMLDD